VNVELVPSRERFNRLAAALARADASWLARLTTRRLPIDRWREAVERRPGDIKVIIDFGIDRKAL
jgi:hypothetical protein